MALGASRMFGIVLPLNFRSPYKAANIIDFWRRWHITLSRFLRDYVYIPLGGNRKTVPRRYENLLLTMLVGGLWHGAGWTFVFWGALHGIYLVINHGWRSLRRRFDYCRAARRAGARDIDDLRGGRRRLGVFPRKRLHDGRQHHFGHGGAKRCRSACAMATYRGWLRVVGEPRHAVRENDVLRPRGTTQLAVLPAGVLLGRSQYAAALWPLIVRR